MKKFIKNSLSITQSFILLFVSSLVIAFFMFYLAPSSFVEFTKVLRANPSLFLLNYIPILLILIIIYFVFNNAVLSVSLNAAIFISLSIVNRVKISLRQDPLLPTDLTLFTEVAAIVKNFNFKFLLIIMFLILLVVCIIFISVKFFTSATLKKRLRIAIPILCLVLLTILNSLVYSDVSIYDSYPVNGNIYFQVNHYNSKGFLYSFIHNSTTLKVQKPSNYNSYTFFEIEKYFEETKQIYDDIKKPHIIMIMGESFSDLSENENISFTSGTDPLKYWKQISAGNNAISGHIIVPNFGGGTSDTEFDVLTACPTRYIGNALPAYSFIRKNFDAFPRILKNLGYDTIAIHPGYPWFYNRLNVYSYFGFDDFIHIDDYDLQNQVKGGYISEVETIDTVIETFDNHIESSDNPYFIFCVTIQNHGPYNQKYKNTPITFKSKIPLTEEEEGMLANYFLGNSDADYELNRLINHFMDLKEPVVVVYFGDHLPGFVNAFDLFEKLEYDIDINGNVEERLNAYKTPFLIWQNNSAKELSDFSERLQTMNLPYNMTISANYLGSTLVELLGYGNVSAIFDYSNDLRKSLPIITNQSFMDSKGNYVESLDEESVQKLDFLKGWVYYKIFDQGIKE